MCVCVCFFFLWVWVFSLVSSSWSWNSLPVCALISVVAPGSPAAVKNTVTQPGPLGHQDALGLTPPLPEHVSAAVVRRGGEERPSINSTAAEA